MLALVATFLFGGYLLIYAAVANGGKFAASPWDALRADAYQGGPAGSGQGGSGGGSTIDHILHIGEKIISLDPLPFP